MTFRTKEQAAQERAKMGAIFDSVAAMVQEDAKKRGGLTPYMFSLTPEKRNQVAREIRTELATCPLEGVAG